jgi:dGTP triphosphohydrolase
MQNAFKSLSLNLAVCRVTPSKRGSQWPVFNHQSRGALLKQITRDYIIKSPSLAAQQHGQRKIIEGLFGEIYSTKDDDSECPDFLPIRLRYLKNITNKTRVWTQLHQHLNAKIYNIDRKLVAVFSKRVASLRMSFILQKKRSTMLRLA